MIPRHIAIIPDGNRRWAKARGLPVLFGHKKGYERLKAIGDAALAQGVTYCTVFAFSTENWKRERDEVDGLMEIFFLALTAELSYYLDRGIRLRVLGSLAGLPDRLIAAIADAEARTAHGQRGQLNLCINYGGRAEILAAVQDLLTAGVPAAEITEERFARALWSHDIPEPELIIRTSGEHRTSGFLTWSGTYSELFFVEKNWPDFTDQDLRDVLTAFASRERRFGQ